MLNINWKALDSFMSHKVKTVAYISDKSQTFRFFCESIDYSCSIWIHLTVKAGNHVWAVICAYTYEISPNIHIWKKNLFINPLAVTTLKKGYN